MSINQSEAKNALGVFILSIHKSLRTSFWYRMYDHCSDDPDGVEIPNPNSVNNDERREAIEKKKILGDLYLMSFRSQTGLSEDVYNELLVKAGLLRKNTTSEGYGVLYSEWKNFCSEIDIDAEFEGSVFSKAFVVIQNATLFELDLNNRNTIKMFACKSMQANMHLREYKTFATSDSPWQTVSMTV